MSFNVLGDVFLEVEGLCLHFLHIRRQHITHQRRGLPSPLCPTLHFNLHQPEEHPVVETSQYPTDPGGNDPGIRSEKNYHLHDQFIEYA